MTEEGTTEHESTDEEVRRFVLEETKERVAYLKFIKTKGYAVDENQIRRFEEEIREETAKLESESDLIDERCVSELQRQLAYVDLFENDESDDERCASALKALLYRLRHIKVKMRPEQNHHRAHFHIEYKHQYSASYAVNNLERLAGEMPKKYEESILKWAAQHQLSLAATWERLNAGEDVRELVIVPPETQ